MMLKNLWERKSGEGAQDFTFWDIQSPVIFVLSNCVYACRFVCDFVQMSVTAHRGQKSLSDALMLELQSAMSWPTWVLGIVLNKKTTCS